MSRWTSVLPLLLAVLLAATPVSAGVSTVVLAVDGMT